MKKISLSSIIVMSIISLGGESGLGIDLYQQQGDSIVNRSQSINPSIDNSFASQISWEELDTVRSKSDSIEFVNRRVRVIGRYRAETRKSTPGSTGNPNFQGTYTTASILLADGTEIPIFPTYHKQSLRSPEEVKIYTDKIVNIVGRIKLQSDRPESANSTQSMMLTSFERIWLDPKQVK
jgi:hypothetical protein